MFLKLPDKNRSPEKGDQFSPTEDSHLVPHVRPLHLPESTRPNHGNWKACIANVCGIVWRLLSGLQALREDLIAGTSLASHPIHYPFFFFFRMQKGPLYKADMHNMKCIPRPGQLKFILNCLPRQNNGQQSRLLSADLLERWRKKELAAMQR